MSVKPRQRGLSMVELIMFIVIVSVAVVGVLQVFALNVRHSPDPMLRKQALAIAEGLLEEVRLANFTFCDLADTALQTAANAAACTPGQQENVGPEAGNVRPFDNVNDYVGALGIPLAYATDVSGTGFPAGYAATVTISADATLGGGAPIAAAGAVLLITVTVSYAGGNVVLQSYRTRYAPNT